MIIAERYELAEELGAGGEARVFRARDRFTGDDVALRLAGTTSSKAPVAKPPPHHPGWVLLLDRGVDSVHGSFAVFELLHGETLGALVAREPLDSLAVWTFAHQALYALGALHGAGRVHGDLNADNFLLHASTRWKLLELPFHRDSPPQTRSPLFGSIYTLSPEQIEGRPPDTRSDLYSLGCLLYYAASQRYPHAGGPVAEIAIGRLRFPPEPLPELAADFPPSLSALTMRLLARDPADRPNADAACQLLAA